MPNRCREAWLAFGQLLDAAQPPDGFLVRPPACDTVPLLRRSMPAGNAASSLPRWRPRCWSPRACIGCGASKAARSASFRRPTTWPWSRARRPTSRPQTKPRPRRPQTTSAGTIRSINKSPTPDRKWRWPRAIWPMPSTPAISCVTNSIRPNKILREQAVERPFDMACLRLAAYSSCNNSF